jgi:predicted GH43/DUF377 family glycosyl hydrolase
MSKNSKRILFPDLKSARYNIASWTAENENVYLITREVLKKSRGNEPDFTNLVLVELNKNLKQIGEHMLWEVRSENLLLEDPRAMASSNGSVVIGFTGVLRSGTGEYVPYPAVTKLKTRLWKEILPAVTFIESFGPGKNTTPVEEDIYFFRQNGEENRHKLVVFSLHDMIPKKIQTLDFPTSLPWAQFRIGTGMPPLWITEMRALMIFHGISIIDGKYIYSLGRAMLFKENGKYRIKVDPNPIITPDYFLDAKGKPLVPELHPHRRVVYCCGGVLKPTNKKNLILFINVGDMNTFLVETPIKKLTEGLF